MRLLKDASLNVAFKLLLMVFALLTNSLIARTLGPDGKGIFTLVVTVSGIVALLASFGLGSSIVYFLGQKAYPPKVVATHLFFTAFFLGFCVTIIGMVSNFLAHRTLRLDWLPSPEITLSIGLLMPFLLIKLYGAQIFAGMQNFLHYNLIILYEAIVLLLLLLFFYFTSSLTAEHALTAFFLSVLVSGIISWISVGMKIGFEGFSLKSDLLKTFARYGLRSYAFQLVVTLNLRVDQLMIWGTLSAAHVGIYSVAVVIAELCTRLATALNSIIFSRISGSDGGEESVNLTNLVLRSTITISVLMAIGLAVFGPLLISGIFGNEFVGATRSLRILLPGTVMNSYLQILSGDLSGRGKPEVGAYASGLSLIVTVIGNLLVLPTWGIEGAAAVSTAAYTLSALVMIIAYLNITQQRFLDMVFLRSADVALFLSYLHPIKRRMA